MHVLFERQLRQLGVFNASAGFDEFVAAVDASYCKFERERQLLDGSLELVSEELLKRNRELRGEIQRRKALDLEFSREQRRLALGQLTAGGLQALNTHIEQVSGELGVL